jgi:glycine/D-amino acid oxidase-like deaminating enzyme
MRLAQESPQLILDLQDQTSVDLEIIRGGTLAVAFDDGELESLRPAVAADRGMGIDTTVLTGDEARRLEPLLSPRIRGALHRPLNYHLNPFRLCQAFLLEAEKRGAQIRYGVEVQDIQVSGSRIDRVVTNSGDFQSDWVILAGGAHTAGILKKTPVKLEVTPARGQAIITEACLQSTPYAISGGNHVYVKQVARGNFYLGSHTEYVGFDKGITLEKITTYVREVAAMLPLVAQLQAIRFFAGFRPMTPDNLPLLGPMPHCPRLVVASGHGRSGILYSAGTGKAVSELIVDGKTELPIGPFRVDRFGGDGDSRNGMTLCSVPKKCN